MKCHKCGCKDKRLFHHHKSYEPEIIVMVCMSCHKKLHARLRREGTCQIPVNELEKLSRNSKSNRKINNIRSKKYNKDVYHKNFTFTTGLYTILRMKIVYNIKTDNICINSRFEGTNNCKLLKINIEE